MRIGSERRWRGGIAFATLWLASPGMAAEPAEVIVITAERHEQALGDVAMSADIASGIELDESGVQSTFDLPLRTPGMVFTTNSVLGQPYIRGVGSDLISAGADSSVATFLDGVYQSRLVAAFQPFYDVEQVEVLKGPQGTLFGRNATGGAVQILTRDPTPELSAGGDLLYGNFNQVRVRGVVNAPLVDGRANARVAGIYQRHDGFTENLFLGGRADDADLWAVRGKLALLPSDGVSVLFSGDYSREDSARGLVNKLVKPFDGSPAVLAGGTVPSDPFEVLFDTDPEANVEQWGVSARLRADLESLTIRSLSAYRRTDWDQTIDLDGTELAFSRNFPEEDSETFTQELQVVSRGDGPLEWLGGVFYLHEDALQILDVDVPPLAFRDRPKSDHRTDAVGVFGELGYRISEHWRASAGLRYSYERKRQDYEETVNGAVVAAFDHRESWDDWTPRFVVEFRPTVDAMVYASASRGFKSGGFNSTVAQPFPFDPESLWAFELGSRVAFWEGRVSARAAAFYYDYEDIQLQVQSNAAIPFPLVENAGSATVWGFEGGWTARPCSGLLIEGSLAYLNTRFDDLIAVDPNDPTADSDQSGNRLPKAPSFSAWVAAQYEQPLWSLGSLTLRSEYRYQSTIYFTIWEDSSVRQDSFSLWNLRLRYNDPSYRYGVSLFALNVADESYRHSNVRVDGQVGNLANFGTPRTFGFEVSARY